MSDSPDVAAPKAGQSFTVNGQPFEISTVSKRRYLVSVTGHFGDGEQATFKAAEWRSKASHVGPQG